MPHGAAINVTQRHMLSVEDSIARVTKGDVRPSLLGWLESIAVSVKLTKVTAEVEAGTLAGVVPLTVVFDQGKVTVDSGPVSRIVDAIGESTIQAKLAEALK